MALIGEAGVLPRIYPHKEIDNAVFQAIKDKVKGVFTGGEWVGRLANDGVGIAPFHGHEGEVPQVVRDELEGVR